ncbi:MAG: CARDB domain-containing protein [Candidatus Micrarchaeaceae archaeon]
MAKSFPLFILFASVLLLGSALASTVVLTGTCSGIVKNNTMYFLLANSGNGTAYSVTVSPYIADATVIGNYSASKLTPGSSANFSIRLANVTAKGSYGAYFIVAYQQGTQFFTALFPCLLYFGNVTATSQLSISSTFRAINYSSGIVNVTLFNEKASNVSATVRLIVPPVIGIVGPAQKEMLLSPYNQSELHFYVNIERAQGASFTGMATAWYMHNDVNFSTISIFSGSQYVARHDTKTIIIAASAAIVVLFVLFIIRASIRSRNRKKQQAIHGV